MIMLSKHYDNEINSLSSSKKGASTRMREKEERVKNKENFKGKDSGSS